MIRKILFFAALCLALISCAQPESTVSGTASVPAPPRYDLLIKNDKVYDGSGSPAYSADIAINGDRIAAIGSDLGTANKIIDATSLAVTLEVMGEGWSMGPLNESMKAEALEQQWDIKYNIEWTTLGEYLQFLLKEGYYADIAVFDPGTIQDRATFAEPHQYATGVHHVLVNGVPVLLDGEHTGATPGRFVKGPGYKGQ